MNLITKGLNTAWLITQGLWGKISGAARIDVIRTPGEIGKITFSGEIQ